MARKIISIMLTIGLLFNQGGVIYAAGELNLSAYFSQLHNNIVKPDIFRPVHLRYFSYDNLNNSYKILLDKGDRKDIQEPELKTEAKELMDYFLIGVTLPNDTFWVNLRPDAPDNIIDPQLEKTDIGKVFLEADLQLKKDTASWTSPQTPEGKAYWNKLYKKAGELFGSENITIPTLTRPWIVPNEIIVRETEDSAYVYKATLKVMLEEDYLKSSQPSGPNCKLLTSNYNFSDPRMKELNTYSTQLIRETIIPKLTKEVNSSQRYAKLRQVYYSLILSRWFKARFRSQKTEDRLQITEKSDNYIKLIDTRDLTSLTSKENWDKTTYFNQYKDSFNKGEYNIKEPTFTAYGQSIRSYISGGIQVNKINFAGVADSPVAGFKGAQSSAVTLELVTNKEEKKALYDNNFIKVELPEQPIAIAASPLEEDTSDLNSLSTEELYTEVYTIMDELDQLQKRRGSLSDSGPDYRELDSQISEGYGKFEEVLSIIAWREDFLELPQITKSSELKEGDIVVCIGPTGEGKNVEYRALRAPISSGWYNKKYVLRKIGSSIDKGFKDGSPVTGVQLKKDLETIQDNLKEANKIVIELSRLGYNTKMQEVSVGLGNVMYTIKKMQEDSASLAKGEIPIEVTLNYIEQLFIQKNNLGKIKNAAEMLQSNNSNEKRKIVKTKLTALPEYIAQVLKAVKELQNKLNYYSSSPTVEKDAVPAGFTKGGIDLTSRAMKIGLERMGSFADLKMVLPELSNVEAIDLDNEYTQIQAMASSGIRPSDMRILEFVTACYYRQEFTQRLSEITACLKEAHTLDEREGKESSETLRLATLLPDALYAHSLN